MDSPDSYFSDDSFSDSYSTSLGTDPFSSPPRHDPFSTPPGADPFSTPPDSPDSFYSAMESSNVETNPFEAQFNLVNYSFEYLNPNSHALSPGSDALSGHFDPDATRLVISRATFEDPRWEPTGYPIAADTTATASVGDVDDWECVSALEASSENAPSEWEQWEVRDVTPRESFPLQRLDPAKSTLYRRRGLESDYGVGEVGFGAFREVEDNEVPGRNRFDMDGQPRASVSGKGFPGVIETGATGTSYTATGSSDSKVKVE